MTDTPAGEVSGSAWEVSLELSDNWYTVPADADPTQYGELVATTLVEEAPEAIGAPLDPGVAAAIGDEFRIFAETGYGTDADMVALYRPEYAGETVAALLVHSLPVVDSTSLVEFVEDAAVDESLSYDLVWLTLPSGAESLREWSLTAAPGDSGLVTETVAHYVPVPDGSWLRLEVSWTGVLGAVELAPMADDIAGAVTFTPHSES